MGAKTRKTSGGNRVNIWAKSELPSPNNRGPHTFAFLSETIPGEQPSERGDSLGALNPLPFCGMLSSQRQPEVPENLAMGLESLRGPPPKRLEVPEATALELGQNGITTNQ